MTKKQKFEKVLSQFDCSNVDYDAKDYISLSLMARAKGSFSLDLTFGFTSGRNPIKCRPLILKKEETAIEVFKLLVWGKTADKEEKSDFLDVITSSETKKESDIGTGF